MLSELQQEACIKLLLFFTTETLKLMYSNILLKILNNKDFKEMVRPNLNKKEMVI